MQNSPEKLKTKNLKDTRLALLKSQDFKCAICGLACSEDQAVMDHYHGQDIIPGDGQGGYVRGVLHRGCNAVEGKIVNALKRYGIKDVKSYLSGLLAYHELHSTNVSGLIHPLHKTAEEKKELAKKRAQKKKAILKALKEEQKK